MTSIKKSISYLNANNQELGFIFTKIKKLMDINDCIIPHLPAYMRDYCQVANVADNTLILMTSSASVFAQVRFMDKDKELLQKINQHPLCSHINHIQFKVRPSLNKSEIKTNPSHRKMSPLSANTADIIKKTAESITDPTLQAIMRRIAERRK